MKKKQKTFAERAKEIKNKYSRAEFDSIERRDMMKELEALRDEQEEIREAMNIVDKADDMDKAGDAVSQYIAKPTTTITMPSWYVNATNPSGVRPLNAMNTAPVDNIKVPTVGKAINTPNSLITPNQKFRPLQTSATPYIVSAAASMLGDLGSLVSMYKTRPNTLNLPRVAPTKVNLQPEREAATRAYNTNKNVALRYSRDMSNPANAYANQMAGLSSLQGSYGDIIGQSYMNEANTNAQLQQQANMTNAQFAAEEAKANLQLKREMSDAQSATIGSISETIPKALRDYRSDYSQNMLMNIIGNNYGLYEPIPQFKNSFERFMYNIRGPQYRILPKQYANENLG